MREDRLYSRRDVDHRGVLPGFESADRVGEQPASFDDPRTFQAVGDVPQQFVVNAMGFLFDRCAEDAGSVE